MTRGIVATVLSLALLAPSAALARQYYYNPSFPNQPGSYNHHVQTAYHTALHSVAVTTVRDPNGNVWSGSPNGGAPGVKVVESSTTKTTTTPSTTPQTYRGLADLASLSTAVAKRLGVAPEKVFVKTSDWHRDVTRATSIFSQVRKGEFRVLDGAGALLQSGEFSYAVLKADAGKARLIMPRSPRPQGAR